MTAASIEDLYLHEILGTPTAGGSGFTLVATRANRDDDGNRTTLWHCDPQGNLRQLSDPSRGASAPLLHPETPRLAFVRTTDAGPRVHLLDIDGGEPRMIESPGDAVVSIEDWDTERDCLLVCIERHARDPDAPAVVESLPFKLDGVGLIVGDHIGLAEIDLTSGACTWLVEDGGDVRAAKWSPDRRALAYVQDQGGLQRQRMQLHLRSGDGERRLLAENLVTMRELAWSPDGTRIAIGGVDAEGASQSFLHIVDVADGTARQHGEIELAIPGCLSWPQADRLLLLEASRGLQRVVAVAPENATPTALVAPPQGHVMSFAARNDRLACVIADASTGPVLQLFDAQGAALGEAGAFNAWRKSRQAPQVTRRVFTVPDGAGGEESIDGWLLQPEGAGPFPLLLDVHGGPETHVTFDLETRVHWPVLVARGWAILALNTVGSGSYGQAFAERLRGHWGEYDLPQYAAAVDTLRSEGLVSEVAAYGHSYGGFLVAWALAERMPLLSGVVSAGVIDQHSHTGTSDSGYYVGPYAMRGSPVDAYETYERLSPVRRAHLIEAPTLILQGTEDMRCPVGQGEQLYTTLVRAGQAEARLVLFPGGQHHVSSTGKPSHREAWYGQLVDWLESHRAD